MGAGKTTLTKLLMRLYDPTEGSITYNGHDLREYELEDLRGRVAAVFQDYRIFAATVAENVVGGELAEGEEVTSQKPPKAPKSPKPAKNKKSNCRIV